MVALHKLLARQIQKYLGASYNLEPHLEELFNVISATYFHADKDRLLIERSLEISSRELTEINRGIEEKVRQRTEELVNQQRTLSTLIDNLPIGVHLVRVPDGQTIIMNAKGVELVGRSPMQGEKSGNFTQFYDIIHEDGSPYPENELPMNITLAEGKTVVKDDIVVRKPDGSLVYLRAVTAPVKQLDGSVHTAVGVFEDISKDRELERSRDEFFSIASHELRTPLTAIRGNTALIRQYYWDDLKDQDLREMIDDVHESSTRLIDIVNDFLDTSRLEQKRMKYQLEAFDSLALAESVIKEYHVTGSRQMIELSVKKPAIVLPMVFADKNRTKQVLINLVGNSIKFTERGSVTIELEVGSDFVKFIVRDTGRGMSPEAQKLLFHKFEQTGSSPITRDSVRGTGLGLYISKMITEQMHGHIQLESSVIDVGTTFSFTLPTVDKNSSNHTVLAANQADINTDTSVNDEGSTHHD